MTPDKLCDAVLTINEAVQVFFSCPDEKEKVLEAAGALVIASLYLSELAFHISNGVDPYDAVIKTLRGEKQLADSQTTLLKMLIPKGE